MPRDGRKQYLKSRKAAVDQNHSYTLATNEHFADFKNKLRKSISDSYKKENALQQLQKILQGKDMVDQHNTMQTSSTTTSEKRFSYLKQSQKP